MAAKLRILWMRRHPRHAETSSSQLTSWITARQVTSAVHTPAQLHPIISYSCSHAVVRCQAQCHTQDWAHMNEDGNFQCQPTSQNNRTNAAKVLCQQMRYQKEAWARTVRFEDMWAAASSWRALAPSIPQNTTSARATGEGYSIFILQRHSKFKTDRA